MDEPDQDPRTTCGVCGEWNDVSDSYVVADVSCCPFDCTQVAIDRLAARLAEVERERDAARAAAAEAVERINYLYDGSAAAGAIPRKWVKDTANRLAAALAPPAEGGGKC